MSVNSKEGEVTYNPLVVSNHLQTKNELRRLFLEERKTLCWAINPENFNVKIWFRKDDGETEKVHAKVDFDACVRGLVGNVRMWNDQMIIEQSGGAAIPLKDALTEVGINIRNLEEKLREFMVI